ncbi:MAG: hypothetical protein M3Q10_04720 [Chloroflexota bacterium]|nr:hypothetical protein [Chloroflexota bacterium]
MARKLDVAAVLARHGIDPASNEAAMVAELAARGWTGQVEELVAPPGATGRTRRFRAMAFRPREPVGRAPCPRPYRRAKGRTAEGALGQVLAAVLERGGGRGTLDG